MLGLKVERVHDLIQGAVQRGEVALAGCIEGRDTTHVLAANFSRGLLDDYITHLEYSERQLLALVARERLQDAWQQRCSHNLEEILGLGVFHGHRRRGRKILVWPCDRP